MQCCLEDDAVLDIPGLKVFNFRTVLRQDDMRLSRTLDAWGAGVLTAEGWQVAQELATTELSGRQTHLYQFVSSARKRYI